MLLQWRSQSKNGNKTLLQISIDHQSIINLDIRNSIHSCRKSTYLLMINLFIIVIKYIIKTHKYEWRMIGRY